MASFPELAKATSSLVAIPYPTVDLAGRHLRAADMLTVKGFGRGGARMTARDAATLLISLMIDHERGGDYAAETARVMRLPLFEGKPFAVLPDYFADGLSISKAKNAGEAMEALLFDCLRERIWRPMEELKRDDILTIGIDPTGRRVTPHIHGPYHPMPVSAAMFVYQRAPGPERRNFERHHILHGRVLLELARLLELQPPPE